MAENLRHALRGVVQASFREHTDKHALKRAGQGYGKVYAHSSKMDLLDKITPFARWIREHYPEVRRPDQLTREHAQAYIDEKSSGWSQATCDGWRSQLVKLGECIEHLCIERVIHKGAYAVTVAREIYGVGRELCLIELEFDACLCSEFFKARLVIGLGVKKSNSHQISPPSG